MKRKILTIVLAIFIIGTSMPYKYNREKTINYITTHAETKSRSMCAWYVMRALQNGGCYPCGIYPAYAYKDILIKLGFREIQESEVTKGDVCVLSQNSKSPFGHIAIYNGENWISDYSQRSLYPNEAYRKESKVHYYHLDEKLHFANIWVSPLDLFEYVKVLMYNHKRIKL